MARVAVYPGPRISERRQDDSASEDSGPADTGATPQKPMKEQSTVWTESKHAPHSTGLVREQFLITLLLLGTAALLIIGPSMYCWFTEGHSERLSRYRAGAHSPLGSQQWQGSSQEGASASCSACTELGGHHHPAISVRTDYVKEVLSGSINGLLMTAATVLGGIGADIPGRRIFAMALASLAAQGLSIGFSTYIIEWSKEEFAATQFEEEKREVENSPEEEISEMVCHYKKRGLTDEEARQVAGVLSKYKDFWVEHMIKEELGVDLPRGPLAPLAASFATATSFIFFGMIPLLGLAVSAALNRSKGSRWYRPQFSTMVAFALAAAALVILGWLLTNSWGNSSSASHKGHGKVLLLLAQGCAASAVALWLSQTCYQLCQTGKQLQEPKEPAAKEADPRTAKAQLTTAQAPREASADGAARQSRLNRALSGEDLAGFFGDTDVMAWPSFRRAFGRSLLWLWLVVCTAIIAVQALQNMPVSDTIHVFTCGMVTCLTTGLGAVPFIFTKDEVLGERPLAYANAVAGGMMLAASLGMLVEAHQHCGSYDWQIAAGLAVGCLFIRGSEHLQPSGEGEGESEVAALHSAFVEKRHYRKAMLIFTVMFCHSAAEGIAVGVAFSKQLTAQFGLYVTLLLAVHNVPEGLAVALVLVPRGVSAPMAAIIATLTSVPQPLLAVLAFLFVDSFSGLLPLGLAFAAGAMAYVCLHELLSEAAEHLGWSTTLSVTALSAFLMGHVMIALEAMTAG